MDVRDGRDAATLLVPMADTADTSTPSAATGLRPVMDPTIRTRLRAGATVRVVQQIAARDYAWGTEHVGTVLSYEQKQTGSWYAHSRGDKLWLDRLVLKKSDGEIFTFNLDEYSHVEILTEAAPEAEAASA